MSGQRPACASVSKQKFFFKNTKIMRIVQLRGCPGQGTRWFATALHCLFAGTVVVHDHHKHSGCTRDAPYDADISRSILEPACHPTNCTYAVIARHPLELKHGRRGAHLVWEAYYGAWARTHVPNVRFFRYEDAIANLCTSAHANKAIASQYTSRHHRCVRRRDKFAWTFWNYTQPKCAA